MSTVSQTSNRATLSMDPNPYKSPETENEGRKLPGVAAWRAIGGLVLIGLAIFSGGLIAWFLLRLANT